MKNKKTLLQIIALFCIELIIFLPFYTVNALTISDVEVTDITSSSAIVNWVTDQHATGIVRYGPTIDLDFTRTHSNFLIEHSFFLSDLNSETTYNFDVGSFNVTGDFIRDNNSGQFYTFTTPDITPPGQVSGLKSNNVTISSALITWDSSVAPDLSHYSIYRDKIKIADTDQTNFKDTNLLSSTFYSYKISAVDLSGNEGLLSDSVAIQTLTKDLTAPTINNLQILEIINKTATINWITNENSTSIVYYGLNDTLNSILEDNNSVINHILTLKNLVENEKYVFIASSCDKNNNCANSTTQSFTILKDVTLPLLDVTIPAFVNTGTIDIIGKTRPFSDVKLYVNDLNLPLRFLDSTKTQTGIFQFFNIVLQKENVIKITVKDQAGKETEKTFRVSVDTEEPEFVLDKIPRVTTEKNVSIIGTVNEPTIINIFLTQDTILAISERVTGLAATASNNSVELIWNEIGIEDFSHYVIYRNDIPIATTEPESYSTFIDLLVNSGFNYTYQVTVVTTSEKETQKSDRVAVTIPAGGIKDIPEPEAINILQDAKEPILSINTTGIFSAAIQLVDDGNYKLSIEFIDRANNKVIFEQNIILDTKAPKIEIISPPRGTSIYENYADEVDIQGITEPNAEVHLFIQRTPLGFLNKSFDISGLPNEIQDIPDADLRADCRFAVGLKEFCSTGADFTTTADNLGNFFFEDVDLTSIFAVGISIREVPLTEFSRTAELRESRKSSLVFIASDKSGNRGAAKVDFNIITCWSGNQTWDIIPLTEFQTPTLISTERLAENNEHIQFFFNYSYQGRGTGGFIERVEISKACRGTELLEGSRFNVSCKILPQGATGTIVNPEGKISYSTIKLDRLPNMDRWLEDDWNKFFRQLGTEITFPLKVRITYKHKVDGKELTEVQTICQEVSYLVDNSRIDPRKVLPDWLLFDFVDFLDESVENLNKVKEEVDKVLEFVVIGCVGSFLLKLVVQVYRRFVTFLKEKQFIIRDLTLDQIKFSIGGEGDRDYCEQVYKNIKFKFGTVKLKYYSDKDLRKCFLDVASAWDTEAGLYQAYRFTCDRVFGHATPSKWTETKTDDILIQKLQTAEGCAVDQSVEGQPLRAVSCRELAEKYKPQIKRDDFNLEDKCFEVFDPTGRQATLYRLGDFLEGDIYNINAVPGFGKRKIDYAVKQTETTFLTAKPQTCAEVCGITKSGGGKAPPGRAMVKGGGTPRPTVTDENARWACVSANVCKALKNNQDVDVTVTSSIPRGFTSDCFYKTSAGYAPTETQQAISVGNDPNQRFECCCLNAVKGPPTVYYKPTDKNLYESPDVGKFTNRAFENKNDREIPAEKLEEMEWSYRYWKEKYQTKGSDGATHFEYNPNRYIRGRDLPACFGQNNWIYDGLSISGLDVDEKATGKLLIIDPAKQYTSTFQCLNIAGINNRITLLNNLMTQLSGCLKQVRTTGTADAGVCKELFTQYVCSSVWTLIQWFNNGCLPFGEGYDFTESENEIAQYISGGVRSVWGSIADSQRELYDEYGNAQLRNLLGAGEEAIARKICLAAFGYDWEINLQDIVDAAYTQSFSTFVQKITGTREFLTIDPQSSQAKYEYRTSWMINPGCDMENYKVELSCVGRNQIDQYPGVNCAKVEDPEGNNCDCKNLDQERTQTFFTSRGGLDQNELEDRDHHDIIGSIYRYDHLKFTLRPDRNIKGDLKEACFPQGHFENGQGIFYFPLRDKTARDLLNCQVDVISGLFKCVGAQSFWDSRGIAYFVSEKINDITVGLKNIVIKAGEPLFFQPTIYKSPGPTQCLVVDVKMGTGSVRKVVNINLDGLHEYPTFRLVDNAQLNRGIFPKTEFIGCGSKDPRKICAAILTNKRLTIDLLSRTNSQNVNIELTFEDREGGITGEIDLNSVSEDILIVDEEQKVLGKGEEGREGKERIEGWWDDEEKAVIVDLKNKGVKFKIRSVGYDNDISFVKYRVEIPAPVQAGADERWTITYALYHIKGENETNCQNFNPSELIKYQGDDQKKTQPITVTSQAVAADKPKIDIKVDSRAQLKQNDKFEIRVDITDDKEVKNRIDYLLIRPDGRELGSAICSQASPEPGIGDKKQCVIKLDQEDPKGLNKRAGLFKIEIEATDSDENKETNSRTFEVACVDKNYESYGLCRRGRDGCGNRILADKNKLALFCVDDFICCMHTGPLSRKQ